MIINLKLNLAILYVWVECVHANREQEDIITWRSDMLGVGVNGLKLLLFYSSILSSRSYGSC